jgi:hypothetical protein
MEVKYGDGQTKFGPGVLIEMTGDEVATAIDAYLVAHGVSVRGPRTIRLNETLCTHMDMEMYVDPSGSVVAGETRFSGSGPETDEADRRALLD